MASDSLLLKAQTVHHQIDDNNDVYDDGCLRIEHNSYYVACNGNMISLARKEFLIISRLARSAERIVPSEEIWRYAWGESTTFNAQSLRVHIHRIRHNLAPFCVKIESLIHVGYRLTTTPKVSVPNVHTLVGFTFYLSSLLSSLC